jgi:hypothetical protein
MKAELSSGDGKGFVEESLQSVVKWTLAAPTKTASGQAHTLSQSKIATTADRSMQRFSIRRSAWPITIDSLAL